MELLRGAQQTIRALSRKCRYAFITIRATFMKWPNMSRTLVPDYRFSLRHHAPLFGDFVLYCSV